jgi:hypothetical protein
MNLSKILDLVKNKHKNISRKANVFTLDEARKLNDKYPYAIVNAYTGRPVYLCEDKESANMMWNKMFRCCATTPLIVDLRNSEEKPMKICEVVRLCKIYGEDTTLAELQKELQGNKVHKCPKCGGTGKITKKRNMAQYWECCDDWQYFDVECDLCNGQGYTENVYKPKMIQDGWEKEKE